MSDMIIDPIACRSISSTTPPNQTVEQKREKERERIIKRERGLVVEKNKARKLDRLVDENPFFVPTPVFPFTSRFRQTEGEGGTDQQADDRELDSTGLYGTEGLGKGHRWTSPHKHR